MKIDTILSDKEKKEVEKFLSNSVQKEAIRKVLLFGAYGNGTLLPDEAADPQYNFALSLGAAREVSDEQLGQDLRGSIKAIELLETAFKQLEKFKEITVDKSDAVNPAL